MIRKAAKAVGNAAAATSKSTPVNDASKHVARVGNRGIAKERLSHVLQSQRVANQGHAGSCTSVGAGMHAESSANDNDTHIIETLAMDSNENAEVNRISTGLHESLSVDERMMGMYASKRISKVSVVLEEIPDPEPIFVDVNPSIPEAHTVVPDQISHTIEQPPVHEVESNRVQYNDDVAKDTDKIVAIELERVETPSRSKEEHSGTQRSEKEKDHAKKPPSSQKKQRGITGVYLEGIEKMFQESEGKLMPKKGWNLFVERFPGPVDECEDAYPTEKQVRGKISALRKKMKSQRS